MVFDNIKTIEFRKMSKSNIAFTSVENMRHIKVLPQLSIVQSIDGYYEVGLGGTPLEKTESGGFFIAPSGVQQEIIHHVNPETNTMICRWVFIDVIINGNSRMDFMYRFPTIIPREYTVEMNSIFDELFSSNNVIDEYIAYYKILKFLFSLATEHSDHGNDYIQKTLKYIESNYKSNIRIDELADNIHMSSSNFHAFFKKNFGTSPISYINHYRLSLAAKYLSDTNKTVSEISNMVGFSDPQYFCKMFKKTYEVSPKQYRQNNKK